MSRPVHFGWFLETGFSVQGWLESGYRLTDDQTKPDLYQRAVRQLEEARFDVLVIQDAVTVPDIYRGTAEANLRLAEEAPKHDPFALTPYLLAVTQHIGIVPTISASFYPPFIAARLLATLQHFSERIGYNVVTSGSDLAAQNFGLDQQIEHDARYDKADEWVDVVRALWRSWEPDAIEMNAETGVYADYRKVRPIHHVGKHFSVRGPLNTAPMPDGEPVLVQAGASPRGRRFAGENADLVVGFTGSPVQMRQYREEVREAAAQSGRDPDEVKVFFIVAPHVAATPGDVAALRERLATLTPERIDHVLAHMSYLSSHDLGQFALDDPLPDVATNSAQGTLATFKSAAPPGSSLRTILQRRAQAAAETLIGTGDEVADELRDLAEASEADGLLIRGSFYEENVRSVTQHLVPALRRRGLIRSDYASTRLRENLATL